MKIEWNIESDYEEDDCLGRILLKDEKGNEISESCTYIDSWLYSLGEAVGLLQEENTTDLKIEISEEPEYILIEQQSSGLLLSFKNNSLHISSVEEYILCVKDAIRARIKSVDCKSKVQSEMSLALEKVLTNGCT